MPKNVVCKKCNNLVNDWCEKVIDSPDPDMQRDCQYFSEKTNADRIRAMSDEELARWMEYEGGGACAEMCGWLNWLQQPAEDIGVEPKPCPFCKFAEVFYGEYDTFSDTTFGGYKIRCRCGYAYRKSVWCDSANETIETWNKMVSE